MSFAVKTGFKMSYLVKRNLLFRKKYFMCCNRFCTSVNNRSGKTKMEDFFFDRAVQGILKRITGIDYNKLFAYKKGKLQAPVYEFVTEKRFKELQDIATAKALEKLQMPPVMEIRKSNEKILTKDPELQGYLETKLLFIDTSADMSPRNRMIVVREVDGTLRNATWDERFRMNQTFFPEPGCELEIPKYFESPYLDNLLDEESYLFVLDSACVQFEPDDPEYHRVTNATYEHIKLKKKFDILRSTRHFGPMAFYFAYMKNIEPLVVDMLERQLISDAADAIKLLFILHPELRSQNIDDAKEMEIIKEYIQRNSSPHKADLEIAMQALEVTLKTEASVQVQ